MVKEAGSKWRRPATYLTGRLSMFVTYPIVTFVIGYLLAHTTG